MFFNAITGSLPLYDNWFLSTILATILYDNWFPTTILATILYDNWFLTLIW